MDLPVFVLSTGFQRFHRMVQTKQHDVIQQAAVQFDVQHTVYADQIVGGSQCLTAGILHRRSLSPQVVDYEHVVAAAALVHLKALSLIQQVKMRPMLLPM